MKNLNEMTVKELKEIAKELHVSNWWNLKKNVLIKKIEEKQNMTDEEKQIEAEQKAREDAAMEAYRKDWRKYTDRFNPVEFMEKFRSGEITLDDEEEPADEPVEQPENDEHDNIQDEEENSSMNESDMQNDAPVEEPELVPMPGTETPDWGEKQWGPEKPEIEKEKSPKPKRGALIEFDGKSQNICKWGEELGISPNTLYGRIYKMGWSVERAFTTPARKSK